MFIVLEFQTNQEGQTTIVPPVTYETINEAKSKYHTILSAAAVSSVPYHTAAIMYHNGNLIATETFEHVTNTDELSPGLIHSEVN